MNALSDALLTLRGVWKYHSFLKRSQYFDADSVLRHQTEWLRTLLAYCHRNVSWYSEAFRSSGVRLTGPDPMAELAKLPILSKNTVRENHGYFCGPMVAQDALPFSTSGTTGEPLTVYTSRNQWIMEQGIIWRHWKWAGYRFRDRMAVLRSYAPKPGQPNIRVDRLKNWTYFSVFNMDDATLDSYAEYLTRWRPRYLRGYPSSLMLLAQHAARRGYRLPTLKAAFTASEVVPPELRAALREAFNVEVFDHYGQAEISCMFHECERHQGLHIDWEYGLLELLPSETPGLSRMIATNLHNYAMPLLRYDTGDLAVGDLQRCACGRVAPVIKAIRGRSDDYILSKAGVRIPTVNLYTYFSKFKEISRFQMVQPEAGVMSVSVAVWTASESDGPAIREKIQRDLSQMTGLDVTVPSTPEFIQTREGKFPAFVQRIKR